MTNEEIISAFNELLENADLRTWNRYHANHPNKDRMSNSFDFLYTEDTSFVFEVRDYEGSHLSTEKISLNDIEMEETKWQEQIRLIKSEKDEILKKQQEELKERRKQADLNNLAMLKAKYEGEETGIPK